MIKTCYIFLLLTCAVGINDAFSQCNSSFEYKIFPATAINPLGSIEVEVSSPEYSCILYSVSGKGVQELRNKSHINDKKVVFNDLPAGIIYRILFIFHDEEGDKLCYKRQISGITVDDL